MDEQKHTKDEVNEGLVGALKHERTGYVQRQAAAQATDNAPLAKAMSLRIGQVDEQIRLRGGTVPADEAAAARAADAEPDDTDPDKKKAENPEPPKGAKPAARGAQTTRA